MQTSWVEAFLAVVDQRGFAAAATHLFRSQGRISSYIAALEVELGVTLFDRRQRPARLTSEGIAFLPHARQALEMLDTARSAAQSAAGLARGDVAVATYPSASAEFLPAVLNNLAHDFPHLVVRLIDRQTRGLDQVLDQGEAYIAIRPTVPQLISRLPFSYQQLWREAICVVLAYGHPLARRERLELADLADEPLVFGGRTTEDAEIARMFRALGIKPRIEYLSNLPQSLVALAQHGLAAGIMNVVALQSIRLDGVTVVPLAGIEREVGVYWTAAAENSPGATAMLRTILRTPPPLPAVDLRGAATTAYPRLFADLTP